MFFKNTFVCIDTSNAPVMIITVEGYEPTVAEFDEYLAAYLMLCEETPAFVLIFDASKTTSLRAELRVRQSKWIEKNRKLLQEKIKELIFIIPNSFVRILLKGIFLLSKPPYPYSVVGDMREAEENALARLNQA